MRANKKIRKFFLVFVAINVNILAVATLVASGGSVLLPLDRQFRVGKSRDRGRFDALGFFTSTVAELGELAMDDEAKLKTLVARLNAGDEEALNELWTKYGEALRRRVRNRLKARGLQVSVESMDVCQSVLQGLVKRIRVDEHEPIENIMGYLVRAAMYKIEDFGDKEKADRRDHRRIAQQGLDGLDLASDDTSPSQRALLNEVFAIVREELIPSDRHVWELRRQGMTWAEIGAVVGQNADSLRIRLERELQRIHRQRGWGDETS